MRDLNRTLFSEPVGFSEPVAITGYIALTVILFSLIAFAGGCGTAPPEAIRETSVEVNLWVTRDFGKENLFNSQLDVAPGCSVLSLLQEHLEVETEYGGGFVSAINGLQSGYSGQNGENGRMADWFYYVNGILSEQGAADYVPAAGDIIWWDYHPWGGISFTPAVVGAFPQPFTGGYRDKNPGTLILAGDACDGFAEQFGTFLAERGTEELEVDSYQEERAVNRSQMVVVIALWEELFRSSFWEGVQEHRDRTGWFAELTPRCFYPLDLNADRQGEGYTERVGAVLATGSGMGDPYPLWLVTATDLEGLSGVVEALIQRPGQFTKMVGALVVDGEVIGLP